MVNTINRASIVFLTASALCFALKFYVFSDWNNRPVALPLPAPGLQVDTPFNIATSGPFQLRVTVPMPELPVGAKNLPMQAPVGGCLKLSIEGLDSFKVETVVGSLHSGGRYEFGKVDFYESDPVSLPKSGDYIFKIKNCEDLLGAYHYGAMVELVRKEKPTESYLAAVAMRGVAWLLLVVGVLLALWGELRLRKSEGQSQN